MRLAPSVFDTVYEGKVGGYKHNARLAHLTGEFINYKQRFVSLLEKKRKRKMDPAPSLQLLDEFEFSKHQRQNSGLNETRSCSENTRPANAF